jgi:predicted RNA-binding protein with PIN domain
MSEGQPSLLLLIDGYNVVAPAVPPARRGDASWLHHERMRLIDRLVKHLDDHVRRRTVVVFDAANPPPDRPSRFTMSGVDVQFAVGYAEADDLVEELIAAHSAPKRLAVVSSDGRIQTAASRRGCATFASDVWLDDLLDGKPRLAIEYSRGAGQGSQREPGDEKPKTVSNEDLEQWMQDFGFDPP